MPKRIVYYAFSADSTRLWQKDLTEFGNDVPSAGLIGDALYATDRALMVFEPERRIFTVDLETGKTVAEVNIEQYAEALKTQCGPKWLVGALLEGNTLYVLSKDLELVAISVDTRSANAIARSINNKLGILWRTPIHKKIQSIRLHGNRLYRTRLERGAAGDFGTEARLPAAVGDRDRSGCGRRSVPYRKPARQRRSRGWGEIPIVALDPGTGASIWRFTAERFVASVMTAVLPLVCQRLSGGGHNRGSLPYRYPDRRTQADGQFSPSCPH